MFGRMMVTPIVQVNPDSNLETAVAALLKAADTPELVRWIEFPASVLLFLLVPGDPESGAVYVLDRKKGTWYAVDFEDEQYGGYSIHIRSPSLLQSGHQSKQAGSSHVVGIVPFAVLGHISILHIGSQWGHGRISFHSGQSADIAFQHLRLKDRLHQSDIGG